MCERLAPAPAPPSRDTFFLVGLFSVLDALMDQPLPAVLHVLPLAEDITQALLAHTGVLGRTLHSVLAYEQGHWEEASSCGYDRTTLVNAYLGALAYEAEWSATVTHA